jgi:hypothetical protein
MKYIEERMKLLTVIIEDKTLTDEQIIETLYGIGELFIKAAASGISGRNYNNHTALLVPDNDIEAVKQTLSERSIGDR